MFWQIAFYTMSFDTVCVCMSLSREKYENIMRTTVFFERFFFESLFYHCILITGKKTTNRCTVPSWKQEAKQSQRFRSTKSRANCWRVRKPPASRVKIPLSDRFPFRILTIIRPRPIHVES